MQKRRAERGACQVLGLTHAVIDLSRTVVEDALFARREEKRCLVWHQLTDTSIAQQVSDAIVRIG